LDFIFKSSLKKEEGKERRAGEGIKFSAQPSISEF